MIILSRIDFNDDPTVDDRRCPSRSTPATPLHYNEQKPAVQQYNSAGLQQYNSTAPAMQQYSPLTPVQRSVFLSPPASPSKKSGPRAPEGAPGPSLQVRPRRPMNGFMLFAKHHRLKLIQQHPGKDNRSGWGELRGQVV